MIANKIEINLYLVLIFFVSTISGAATKRVNLNNNNLLQLLLLFHVQ